MTTFTGTDARQALVAYGFSTSATLPKLAEIVAEPDWLGSVVKGTEYLYAQRGNLDQNGMNLLADLSQFISTHNFYGKGARCAQINGVALRIANGGEFSEALDPEIDPEFVTPEPAEPEVVEPEPEPAEPGEPEG